MVLYSNIVRRGSSKHLRVGLLSGMLLGATSQMVYAQSPGKIDVPDWSLPGSATHKQVPPPPGFHRASVTKLARTGMFDGQTDVGAALVPGSSSYNKATKQYTIKSAGYNIWYTRDEFRYLWKKMSGDVSLAADVSLPDTAGYGDRKVVVIIRQSLDDDAKEAMVALHGAGLVHLAWRPEKGKEIQQMKVDTRALADQKPDDKAIILAKRIGIEKRGDDFTLFISMNGEPMHQYGAPVHLHIDGPFYVGIGFCSHLPATASVGVFSNVILENVPGKVK